MGQQITYREMDGLKYQLLEDYTVFTEIRLKEDIFTPPDHSFVILTKDGELIIKAGYAWDGPSGPSVDTKNFMRGALVHDALYQLMRTKKLDAATYRGYADKLLKIICREDGMSRFRSWYVFKSVRWFAGSAAKPEATNENIVFTAP